MGVRKYLCNAGNQTIRLGRSYTQTHRQSESGPDYGSKRGAWLRLWKKIRRDKNRVHGSPVSSKTSSTSYDSNSYSQNFDQGMGWMEPDNFSRSFSARFADPSMVLGQNRSLLDLD